MFFRERHERPLPTFSDLRREMNSGNTLLDAALSYAKRGWHVLPLWWIHDGKCACGGANGCTPGKHPHSQLAPRGCHSATTDENLIRSWWAACPSANIGIATGEASGIFIVGPDGAKGVAELADLERDNDPLPATPTAKTGSGGEHIVLQWPANGGIRNKRNHRDLSIDIRGEGGYFVAAPSRNGRGPYRWSADPETTAVAEPPAWLLDWCQDADTKSRGDGMTMQASGDDLSIPDRVIAYLDACPPAVSGDGGHDQTLTVARAVVYGFNLGPEFGYQLLEEHWNPRCIDKSGQLCPWSEDEFRRKCMQAHTVPFNKPRGYLLGPTPVNAQKTPDGRSIYTGPRTIVSSKLQRCEDSALWVWDGYLAGGAVTLFSALFKCGKTTLFSHMLRQSNNGGTFLGRTIKASRFLYVTEESETLWAERRDRLGLGDNIAFWPRPFLCKPGKAEWDAFLTDLRIVQEREKYDAIILDSLANLWPVRDENSSGEVGAALMPLHHAMGTAALCLVHQMRKSDGGEGTAARGSGALMAFVDIILEMRRFDPANHKDTRRVLTGYGRWDGRTPAELVVQLEGGNYRAEGDRSEAHASDAKVAIERILAQATEPLTVDEILTQWPTGGTRRAALVSNLDKGAREGWVAKSGKGVKGDPTKYSRIPASTSEITQPEPAPSYSFPDMRSSGMESGKEFSSPTAPPPPDSPTCTVVHKNSQKTAPENSFSIPDPRVGMEKEFFQGVGAASSVPLTAASQSGPESTSSYSIPDMRSTGMESGMEFLPQPGTETINGSDGHEVLKAAPTKLDETSETLLGQGARNGQDCTKLDETDSARVLIPIRTESAEPPPSSSNLHNPPPADGVELNPEL
jgi:hypothetical protein